MRVLIYGAGAMGSVFGGFLSQDNEVTVIGREKHVAAINKEGLRVSGIWGEHRFRNLAGRTNLSQVQRNPLFDLIMITTKAYDTGDAVRDIQHLVGECSAVMSMQNGIGNEDVISAAVGVERTMGGMAIFGARLIEPGHVEVTVYASECLVGDLREGATKRAHDIARALSKAGIPTLASDNVLRDKWMKAFYNIALNPLSAILRVPYGDLGKSEETKPIMKAVLKEAFSVARAQGIPLKLTDEEYFTFLIDEQLPPTAGHKSSMLQDIERGKQTEIDYLNGAVANIGRKLGVKTPVNETVTHIIKAMEVAG